MATRPHSNQMSNLSNVLGRRRHGTGSQDPLKRGDETDPSVGSPSDSEPEEEEYGQSRHRPAAPLTTPAAQPSRQRSSTDVFLSDHTCLGSESDSDSDSDHDSGYCSLDEDADERAEYYDDLLERFRKEGPSLANHGVNTTKMAKE